MDKIPVEDQKRNRNPIKVWSFKHNKGIALALVGLFVLTTFGFGPLSINLYKSEVRKDEAAYNQNMKAFNFDQHSYQIKYYFDEKFLSTHRFEVAHETTTADFSEIELEVHEKATAYEGNYFMPIYKDYTVKYTAFMNDEGISVDSASLDQFSAKVEGVLGIKVFGFCTISKAKEIAQKEIEASVAAYIKNQMSQAMDQ